MITIGTPSTQVFRNLFTNVDRIMFYLFVYLFISFFFFFSLSLARIIRIGDYTSAVRFAGPVIIPNFTAVLFPFRSNQHGEAHQTATTPPHFYFNARPRTYSGYSPLLPFPSRGDRRGTLLECREN